MSDSSTARFEAWPHNHIQDEPVDTERLPFSDEFFHDRFEAMVGTLDDDWDSMYRRTSHSHGRSYEVAHGRIDDGKFIASGLWEDRYGNIYSTLTTKGNNFTEQKLFSSSTAPSGIIPYGLLEGDALKRVLTASRIMRAAKIDTEWIVRVLEPQKIQFEDEAVDPSTFKRRLLDKVITHGMGEDEPDLTVDRLAQITEALDDMSFFVTLRAMSIPDRPSDFLNDNKQAALVRLERVFKILHAVDQELPNNQPPADEHIANYLTNLLPHLLGENMAKLHNLGLVHRFPVAGNVNLLGGIVDLDSVHGEALGLGDKPVTNQDYSRDIHMLFDDHYATMQDVLWHLETIGIIPRSLQASGLFREEFLTTYLETRQYDPTTKQGARDFLETMKELEALTLGDKEKAMVETAVQTLSEDRKINYTELDYDELVDKVLGTNIKLDVAVALDSFFYDRHEKPSQTISQLSRDQLSDVVAVWVTATAQRSLLRIFEKVYNKDLAKELELPIEDMTALGYGLYLLDVVEYNRAMNARADLQELYQTEIDAYLRRVQKQAGAYELLDLSQVGIPDEEQLLDSMPLGDTHVKIKSGVPLKDLMALVRHRTHDLNIVSHEHMPNVAELPEAEQPFLIVSNARLNYVQTYNEEEALHPYGGVYVAADVDTIEYIAYVVENQKRPGSLSLTIVGDTTHVLADLGSQQ